MEGPGIIFMMQELITPSDVIDIDLLPDSLLIQCWNLFMAHVSFPKPSAGSLIDSFSPRNQTQRVPSRDVLLEILCVLSGKATS